MLISNILKPSPPSQQPPAESAEAENKQQDQSQAEASSSDAAEKSAPAAAAPKASAAEATQSSAKAKPVEATVKTSDADNEAFLRAAAQRSVDSIRTRALIDNISPVDNAGVAAAKSYLTAVEPKAPEAEAETAASAKKEPLNKAA